MHTGVLTLLYLSYEKFIYEFFGRYIFIWALFSDRVTLHFSGLHFVLLESF